jgi:His-Xaa-Ser system protein HxsD
VTGTAVSPPKGPGAEATEVLIDVDLRLYPRAAIMKTCYWFSGRCTASVEQISDEVVRVRLVPKSTASGAKLEDEFRTELLDQVVRAQVAEETKNIRELIVAQAFVEADFHGS